MPYAGPAQCHATQPAGPASAVHLPMQKQFPQLFHNEPNRNNDIGVRVFGSSNAEQLEMAKLFNDIIEATPEKREAMTLEKWGKLMEIDKVISDGDDEEDCNDKYCEEDNASAREIQKRMFKKPRQVLKK